VCFPILFPSGARHGESRPKSGSPKANGSDPGRSAFLESGSPRNRFRSGQCFFSGFQIAIQTLTLTSGDLPSGYVKIAIENGHLQWFFPLKMVIFHSYVSLPEGNMLKGFNQIQRIEH